MPILISELKRVFNIDNVVLTNRIKSKGLAIPKGYGNKTITWKIEINKKQSKDEQLVTLLHEIAEIIIRDPNNGFDQPITKKQKKISAIISLINLKD